MKHRIHILRGLVAALALAGALPAAAGAREPDLRRPVGGLIARHAERLGLTGQPLAAVQAIVAASGKRHAALLARLDEARAQMRELLSQPVPDAQAVMAQADAIGTIEADLHKNRLQAILDIRNQLTPEQRTELLRIRDEEHAKREAEAEHGECMQDHAPGAAPSPR